MNQKIRQIISFLISSLTLGLILFLSYVQKSYAAPYYTPTGQRDWFNKWFFGVVRGDEWSSRYSPPILLIPALVGVVGYYISTRNQNPKERLKE